MLAKVSSAATFGIDAVRITVEVNTHRSENPGFIIVGLPDAAVRESYSRVRSALYNCGFRLPPRFITVNLSPADVRKAGSGFDLPMAIGILVASHKLDPTLVERRVMVGELSLDGTISSIRGALSISRAFHDDDAVDEVVVPAANANEAAAVGDVAIIPVGHLGELVDHLRGEGRIEPHVPASVTVDIEDAADFCEVRGQTLAKRSLEVAAAGSHNVMMIGPPGSGKTMLARRMPSILPELSLEEAIDTTRIHSVTGMLDPEEGLVRRRPFRAPHHTISYAGLVGGGSFPRPGEVSLAHNGVLFLDELPEFRREVLEVLRQPMEDRFVTISRATQTLTFPSSFTLAAALNPCPCGYFNDPRRTCLCGQQQIARYLARISGPLLDRIDLQIEVPALSPEEIAAMAPGEPSARVRSRVEKARAIQQKRYAACRIESNGEMTTRHLREFCAVGTESRQILERAVSRLALSARAHDRILKVARTIADLDQRDQIGPEHIGEATQYRALDKAYFRA